MIRKLAKLFKGAGDFMLIKFKAVIAVPAHEFVKVFVQGGQAVLVGQTGMALKKVVVSLLLAFVGIIFVLQITPQIENGIVTTNITNTFTIAMLNMAKWLLPVGAIIGIFYGVFRMFGGSSSRGD